MEDLYSTLFYKIRFSVGAKDKESDLLWSIILHIKDWMTNKHNSYKKQNLSADIHDWSALKSLMGGQIIGKNVRIVSENCFVEDAYSTSYWACRIIETPKAKFGTAPRRWITEIGIEPVERGIVSFSCIISYCDRPGFVGECDALPMPSVPNIVRRLWSDPELICQNGIDEPCAEPKKLIPGDFMAFWERVKNEDRTLPYIYVSPRISSENEPAVLLAPEALAIAVGGNAMVYYAEDIGVTDEMNYFCPEAYKCYGGSLRIYYPGVDETQPQDALRHRFIGYRTICDMGADHIVQILRRAIAQDASVYDRFFRIEDCREKRNSIIRQKRLEELKKLHILEIRLQHDQHSEEIQQLQGQKLSEAIEEEKKRLEAEDRATQLEIEIDLLREENYKLTTENDSYRGLAKANADLQRACNSRLSVKEYPATAEELVQYFDAVFGDKIAFSDDAMRSLKKCTIPLDELWRVLFSLATIMCELHTNGSGDIYKEFRMRSGIDVSRGEGMMTRQNKKLMRQYETKYHGETIDIEPHITYAKIGQSIHFGFSEKDQKVVVGWCGEHKDNYTTKKVH